jgi:hypothetical protein
MTLAQRYATDRHEIHSRETLAEEALDRGISPSEPGCLKSEIRGNRKDRRGEISGRSLRFLRFALVTSGAHVKCHVSIMPVVQRTNRAARRG